MAEAPHSLPKKVEKCPSAAPPQQHNDLPQFQLLEKDAGRDQTQGTDSTHSWWHSVRQMFMDLRGTWCRERISVFPKAAAEPGPTATQSISPAPSLDLFGDRVVSSPSQVPGFVRNMHQRLVSNGPPDEWLLMDILRLTEAHPTDVAVTLLRCAPSCDRFVVNTVKALLHHLRCLDLLMAVERRCAWDTLLCADTHHYAVGLLASWALLSLLCAFQVLDCLDLSEWGNLILEIMTKHLQSESMERCHLALKGLVVLSQDPSMAKKICSLSERLVELLRNEDTEVVKRSLSVFTNLLLNKDIQTSSSTAPKLAEALRPLFDHDNSHVQQLSIHLYQDVMESVEEKGKQPLKMLVSQSLLPLFFHCHDENQRVAQASREALLSAVTFLKRKGLQRLLQMDELWSFGEHLLAEDRSRAAEHLRRALPYLESPQEPLREAAVRAIGIATLLIRGQPEELQLICEALQALRMDDSPSNTNQIVQVIFTAEKILLGRTVLDWHMSSNATAINAYGIAGHGHQLYMLENS
ncbi:hypothetical protein RLOC_00005749 [Lonchura striata]|uniref:Maestro/Maestro-like HEAT-repeats domain-containing protein n=1 Tax=Lonchura striata TaxID=40157 RepID=A0A218U9T6_9PASE|nr:hypothetical protein RLOC_00005749 [Lonchura striata domestica]